MTAAGTESHRWQMFEGFRDFARAEPAVPSRDGCSPNDIHPARRRDRAGERRPRIGLDTSPHFEVTEDAMRAEGFNTDAVGVA
jgi:hypothetical protein